MAFQKGKRQDGDMTQAMPDFTKRFFEESR